MAAGAPGGDRLLAAGVPMAERLAALARRCRGPGIPVIFVNDDVGRWRSDFRTLRERLLAEPLRGRPTARLRRPEPEDASVRKLTHSGFYTTTLALRDMARVPDAGTTASPRLDLERLLRRADRPAASPPAADRAPGVPSRGAVTAPSA